jgi:hypothetical protein
MINDSNNSGDDEQFLTADEAEQASDSAVAQAIMLVQGGQAIDRVMELFADLPEPLKQKIRLRLQAAALEKEAREHEMARQTREKAADKSTGKFLGLFSGLIAKETLEKLQVLFMNNPLLLNEVRRLGQDLTRRGVESIRSNVSEAQLGELSAPTVGVAVERDKEGPQR